MSEAQRGSWWTGKAGPAWRPAPPTCLVCGPQRVEVVQKVAAACALAPLGLLACTRSRARWFVVVHQSAGQGGRGGPRAVPAAGQLVLHAGAGGATAWELCTDGAVRRRQRPPGLTPAVDSTCGPPAPPTCVVLVIPHVLIHGHKPLCSIGEATSATDSEMHSETGSEMHSEQTERRKRLGVWAAQPAPTRAAPEQM